jgi:hypothetical protein
MLIFYINGCTLCRKSSVISIPRKLITLRSDFTPSIRWATRRMFKGAGRPRRYPCQRFRHPVPVAIFLRTLAKGKGERAEWFHGIWKVSRAKTAGTHKEGGSMAREREEKQLLCVEGGPEERKLKRYVVASVRPDKPRITGYHLSAKAHVMLAWIFGGNLSFAGQKQWRESKARNAILETPLPAETHAKNLWQISLFFSNP